ncbi:Acg family FMN-binding oxidoreductase [Streptomyces radicis]|uniref:Nitroreductase domain-containing protein n=1 Tax=Streptomyces radicis TaxID=1750517 RepID=A0A3A9W4Q2_9ACTN|nr:hypothetical protein [Streptomyces radicis]RKN04224.1 hypothetical protein D7319_28945 [Streptomyces radicis]RKN14742.1 hypothetical protein D7318_28705 [Streptomyces radicis]
MQTGSIDAAALTTLLSAASAAPSIHNTQPWRYRLVPDTLTLEVRAARERALPHADPLARALHVSVGGALFNLRVAATHLGLRPVVRLLPCPDEPVLLGTLRIVGTRRAECHGPDLYPAVWRRHSSRFPFARRRPPDRLLAELADAALVEHASLAFPDDAEVERLLRLTAEAEARNNHDRHRRAETLAWLRDGTGDGLTAAALGPRDATGHLPLRDFTGLRRREDLPTADFEARPLLAVLSTAHDRRTDWLRAGQALERVLLTATARTLRTSLLHQALEWPDLRWALRDPRAERGHAQMLIRLGYGPLGPATPRRPVGRTLDGEG